MSWNISWYFLNRSNWDSEESLSNSTHSVPRWNPWAPRDWCRNSSRRSCYRMTWVGTWGLHRYPLGFPLAFLFFAWCSWRLTNIYNVYLILPSRWTQSSWIPANLVHLEGIYTISYCLCLHPQPRRTSWGPIRLFWSRCFETSHTFHFGLGRLHIYNYIRTWMISIKVLKDVLDFKLTLDVLREEQVSHFYILGVSAW